MIELNTTHAGHARHWNVLGIETSCDDTGIAIYSTQRGLLANLVHSQIDVHSAYGGVVPELASRDHIQRILPLIMSCLHEANCSLTSIDAIAYTQGPGLAGSLLVGASVAESLCFVLQKPCLGIHHLEGHLLSPLLSIERPDFPFLALLVSGGHTQIVQVNELSNYAILGDTLDDAAGEAFDKTAKLLGLPYPGGPCIAKLAQRGGKQFTLPRPLMNSGNLNFSFSGLKTAVMQLVKSLPSLLSEEQKADICFCFQEAITDVLSSKAMLALKQTGLSHLVVAGGVSANIVLRQKLDKEASFKGAHIFYPPLSLCSDNGAMIALAGALHLQSGAYENAGLGDGSFKVRPRWSLA